MHSLKPAGLPPDSRRISRDEVHHLDRRRKRAVTWPARCSPRPSARRGSCESLRETLAAGNTPPCPGLAPWLILSSTILIWSSEAMRANIFGIEAAVAVAATEIAGSDFPDDVAAVLAVVGTDAALAGVMREVAFLGARVQRAYGVCAERAKTHRRNVEHRGRIRLACNPDRRW